MTYYGAVVSRKDESTFEYLLPENFSEALRIPEYGKLTFDYSSNSKELIPAFYDSDLFKSIEQILSVKGKITTATYFGNIPNIEKLSKAISQKIGFSNATFRMGKVETQEINYPLIVFKYQALSDDKQEGVFPILLDELNLSILPVTENFYYLTDELKEGRSGQSSVIREKITRIIEPAYAVAIEGVKEKLKDFIKSMEKRLNRDIRRIYDYYETLKEETNRFIEKAKKNAKTNDADKLLNKLDAITTEQKWKVHDLVSRYSLKLNIEPLCLIHITTQSILFWIDIRRRSQSRPFALTYNPLLKQMDPIPCEACFYPKGNHFICDDRLHIVCPQCFKECPNCKKKYCKACHPKGCPKCLLKGAKE